MKLATIQVEGRRIVALVNNELRRVSSLAGPAVTDMLSLIGDYDTIKGALRPGDHSWGFDEVTFEAPITRPARNIMCVGKNYHEHAHEFTKSGFDSSASSQADAIPKHPIIFTKAPESVIGPDATIRYPHGVSEQVDYEVELAVIIGKGGKGISKTNAFSHVWGYTIINDMTARDLQARHKQWFLGKSLDTFCPMGPILVTADEVDATNLDLKCWVNNELRQNANTRDLIFDIPTLIETISAGITLMPGDIIATGTPAGVGIGFTPPKFLKPGDRIVVEIAGIGRMTNPIG